jgi:pimeloyl-ACP methyl ester carboxylesterase
VEVLEGDPAYQSFRKTDPENWNKYAENLRGQSVDGAIHVLSTVHWNRTSLFDDQARLAAFDRPVLLVTGDDDYYLVGETNAFLRDVLPDASWHRFPGTGHLVNIERAAEFNALLADHVQRAE